MTSPNATRPRVRITTDGACSANGRKNARGGWAAILSGGGREKVLTGSEAPSTNNRMELRAVIAGLGAVKPGFRIELVTDSTYVAHAITKGWIAGWRKRGWKTSSGSEVANRELWLELVPLLERHRGNLKVTLVRGHSGHPDNERADRLAVEAARAAT